MVAFIFSGGGKTVKRGVKKNQMSHSQSLHQTKILRTNKKEKKGETAVGGTLDGEINIPE